MEVLFVDRSCAGDEADLVYLPALSLDHHTDGAAEGSVLALGCFLSSDKVMFAAIRHPFMLGRTAIPSGRIRQKLSFMTVSLGIPSWILLCSAGLRGRAISRARAAFHIVSCVRFRYCISSKSAVISSQIVWRHFSPETHENFHSGAVNRANSTWISRQH